eukprot:CAMPEP_0118908656 /NCGR_PEP_ID=MMETSP1166-20130328/11575_1 /TAXON_ID=1104430 /ORGANISM="Chrysoreinhardia sp, Strain CCMP3193" /LENGTH=128 /DNA_ID=CAMNT_0006848053 /DNA_START=11 /DNA_END=397 /DNA_ORIENTATION=-
MFFDDLVDNGVDVLLDLVDVAGGVDDVPVVRLEAFKIARDLSLYVVNFVAFAAEAGPLSSVVVGEDEVDDDVRGDEALVRGLAPVDVHGVLRRGEGNAGEGVAVADDVDAGQELGPEVGLRFPAVRRK